MKRTATAALAAATAMSLAVAPAFAEENTPNGENNATLNATDEENGGSSSQGEGQDGEKTGSSDITDEDAKKYFNENKDKATGIVKSATETKEGEEPKELSNAFLSSIKSDAANDWEPGKTANILLGTGIGAVVLGLLAAIAAGGVIPGLNLPF